MSQYVKNELLSKMQRQYINRNREGKTTLIDMMVDVHGYSRKYAIKLLCGKTNRVDNPRMVKGHPIRYGEQVVDVLKWIWKVGEQPCGKRLVIIRWILSMVLH